MTIQELQLRQITLFLSGKRGSKETVLDEFCRFLYYLEIIQYCIDPPPSISEMYQDVLVFMPEGDINKHEISAKNKFLAFPVWYWKRMHAISCSYIQHGYVHPNLSVHF